MIFGKQSTAALLMALFVATTLPLQAGASILHPSKKKADEDIASDRKPSPAQNALIDRAIVREKTIIKTVKERAPLVEDYIQNMKPDPVLGQVPESDQHFLGRVEFKNVIGDNTYAVNKETSQGTSGGKFGFFKNCMSYIGGLGSSLRLNFHEAGFVQMLLMDSNGFDRQHYKFGYVRNDFLGNTPTAVFDVTPISEKKERGRFFGRIWIETRDGNVVRFNGSFAGSDKGYAEYYHFDSWRTNVQPDLWLPTSFYVEESDPRSVSRTLKFKAINHIWGYVLKVPPPESENTSMEVVGATDVSNDAQ